MAAAAALLFAVTPTFWSQAVVAEVYTLHAAFVAAILLAALAWADRPTGTTGWLRLYLLAGLVGLSLTHHRTTLLLLPGLAVFFWLEWRVGTAEHPERGAAARNRPSTPLHCAQEMRGGLWGAVSPEQSRRTTAPGALPRLRSGRLLVGANTRLLAATALLLAPLLLYAYIPLVAPRAPYFSVVLGPQQRLTLYEPTLSGFLAHISGSVFSSALAMARGPWLAELAGRLAGEVTWPGVALGIVGILWLAWRDRRTAALTGLSFVAFAGFNALYAIGDIHVFYIPVYLLWVLWLAAGADALGHGLAAGGRWAFGASGDAADGATAPAGEKAHRNRAFRRFAPLRTQPAKASIPGRWRAIFRAAIAAIIPILLLVLAGRLLTANFARVDRSADRTARAAWDAVLAQPIPQDAILITNDRDEMAPQWYLRYVEARRADLTGLFPLIQPGRAWSDVAAVTEQALGTGRPVYLIKPMPGLEVKFLLVPVDTAAAAQIGSLVRVAGLAAQQPLAHASGVIFGEQVRLVGYEAQPAEVSAGQPLEVVLEWEVMAPLVHDYTTFVHLVNAEGRVIGQSDHRAGGVYYPTGLWRVGDRLRDVHALDIAVDPGPAPYRLEVGLYRLAPALQHLGSPQQVGELGACG